VAAALSLAAVGVPLSVVGWRYGPLVADEVDGDGCAGCHRALQPALVGQWLGSRHFVAGVGCADCHGRDHDAMFAAEGAVSAGVCARCHPDANATFAKSGHARAAEGAAANARFLAAPDAVRQEGCAPCHDIGRPNADGTRGRCNDCHSGHRFAAADARDPAACRGCHMGPDHPQTEAWVASKHGIIYAQTGDPDVGPTCATCHMPRAAGHDLVGVGDDRARVVETCRRCHAETFAERSLRRADAVVRVADDRVAEAQQIVAGLGRDGLITPAPADRPPHPHQGHAMVLGADQLYSDTSPVEQDLFRMSKFHRATTVAGAMHFSADHTHWLGYAELQDALTRIRAEASRLREGAP
jgi:hypothetical protein